MTYKDGILHCSCPRTNTYGDICIHSLIVAKSHKNYDQPTHHDYSVVWWKSFLHFSLIHNDEELAKSFIGLKLKEQCGIRIDGKTVTRNPVLHGKIPQEYIVSDEPNCLNHVLKSSIDYNVGSIPTGLSQLSCISQEEFTDTEQVAITSNNTKRSVYSFLVASFKELCSIYESNTDHQEILNIRSYLQTMIKEKKQEIYLKKQIKKKMGLIWT